MVFTCKITDLNMFELQNQFVMNLPQSRLFDFWTQDT